MHVHVFTCMYACKYMYLRFECLYRCGTQTALPYWVVTQCTFKYIYIHNFISTCTSQCADPVRINESSVTPERSVHSEGKSQLVLNLLVSHFQSVQHENMYTCTCTCALQVHVFMLHRLNVSTTCAVITCMCIHVFGTATAT